MEAGERYALLEPREGDGRVSAQTESLASYHAWVQAHTAFREAEARSVGRAMEMLCGFANLSAFKEVWGERRR